MTGTTERVLVATDLTEASHEAVHFAAMLAKTVPATLELLHVVDMVNVEDLPEHTDPAVTDYVDAIRTRLERRLASQGIKLDVERTRCEALGARCETGIADGRVWEVLLQRSQETKASFIVVGPHAKGPGERALGAIGEFLLGSTADRVVRHSRAPVWVVPSQETAPAEAPFRALMVAVDFSSVTARALDIAADLARKAGGELHLVHILPVKYRGDSNSPCPDNLEGAPSTVVCNDGKARLHRLASAIHGLTVHEHVRVAQHSIHEELIDAARDVGASGMVLGSHNRSMLDHMVLGSTAERCAKRTTLPLLIVRG